MNKRYFHTFDALRSLAFFKVLLLHLPITAFTWFNFIRQDGGIGVQFFFVLSGFLISYLILEEKTRTNKLDLKYFFVKRSLRIWPLYFLMVGFAYATPAILNYFNFPYSNDGYEPDWKWSITFLENYKMILENDHPNVSPLVVMWSLCIEEHFYILWGLLLYFLPVRAFPKIVVASMVVAIISRKLFLDLNLKSVDLSTNVDLFAIGGLLAYFIITRKEAIEGLINSITSRKKFIFIITVVLAVLFNPLLFNSYLGKIIQPSVMGVLFTLLLAVFIPAANSWKIGDGNILSRLGKISYGLYMFHTIIINLLMKIFSTLHLPLDNLWNAILFIISTLGLTIICSIFSYKLLEQPILSLRKFFIKGEKPLSMQNVPNSNSSI